MEKIEFELVADTKQSNKNIENVNKSIVDLNKNLETTGKDAEAGMEAISDGAKKAGKSSMSLGKIMKGAFAIFGGAGIVALAVKIFNKFADVLKENQNVANLFATATEAVSIVFTDLVNFLLNNISKESFFSTQNSGPLETCKTLSVLNTDLQSKLKFDLLLLIILISSPFLRK